jgi:RNA polymerase-binding protein DksA
MEKRRMGGKKTKTRANTADVLGEKRTEGRIPSKWRKHYDRLIKLRNHLIMQQADLTKDALEEQPSFSTHQADAATDSFDRDLALGMLSSEQDALHEVDEAVERIKNGTYGVCELTGKPIEESRLEAVPWTRFRAGAEKQLEKERAVNGPRLGRRETVIQRQGTEPKGD